MPRRPGPPRHGGPMPPRRGPRRPPRGPRPRPPRGRFRTRIGCMLPIALFIALAGGIVAIVIKAI